MSIRIQRNENANAITFVGSSQPAYWNNCLEGEVNETDISRINVVNTVRTTDSDNKVYEFFAVPFTEFRTALGTTFADAQACADYITAQANATAIGILEFGATDVADFQRDATNTTILVSTGDSYPVNSIKAVAQADGTITIKENVDGGADLLRTIRRANVTFGGQTQAQQLVPVVNALNSLFSVTPVGAGADDRFVSNTYNSHTATTSAFGDVSFVISGGQPVAMKGTNTGSAFNDGFYTTTYPVSSNGEYFQFDNTGHDALKKAMIGLMKTSDITSAAVLTDNTVTGEDMDLAVRLKPNATYEHSPYGAVIENGFFSYPQRSDSYRAGIDDDGRLFISHYDEQASEWQVIVRSALVTANEEYSLVIFLQQEGAKMSYVVTSKEIYTGVALTYNYIESPDNSFYYPLFATEAEANQVDTNNGGSGTSHSHVFVDELPSSSTWYMPTNGGTHAGASAPSNTAEITYNVISTGADASYAPAAFSVSDLTVNENTAVYYQVSETGDWTTTISGLMTPLTLSGNYIAGTTPEVPNLASVTPSTVQTATVTRTNSYGSTSTTFDVIVVNTTVPTAAITGFTHIANSTAMVDADTLGDGGAVTLDNLLDDGNRFHISREFVDATLIPSLPNAGDTLYIGIPTASADFSNGATKDDFVFCWRFVRDTVGTRYKISKTGTGLSDSMGIWMLSGGSLLYDFYISNKGGVLELTGDQYQFNKDNEPTVTDGGSWSINRVLTGQATESKTIVMASASSTPDITLTNLSEYALPSTSSNTTSWTKAVDFTPTGEYLNQVHTSVSLNALQMGGQGNTVTAHSTDTAKTTDSTDGRPWAMTIVFKPGFQTGGQYVWNCGAGSANNVDNIAVRTSSNYLYFSWGRDGYQSICLIESSLPVGEWYGLYIAFKGQRYSGTTNSSANMANAFDIRLMSSADSFASVGVNKSTAAAWVGTSNMARSMTGAFTIGGQGSVKSYNGKVASMVVTSLHRDDDMPVDAEIMDMITDPNKWVTDYKIGNSYRNAYDYTVNSNFQLNNYSSYSATQAWLMGDGSQDSFTNGTRNLISPSDGAYTKMGFNNMVSNDIETVSINGLS